jgi:hypothetical protein
MPFYIYFIIVSFLASIGAYFKKEAAYLRLFPFFLLISIIIEISGYLIAEKGGDTNLLYNCFSIFEFVFYFFVLHEIIQNTRAKKIIFHAAWIYVILVILNFIFVQKITGFASMTYALGCLVIVAICIFYFLELFQLSQSVDLLRQPAFWICSGLLFFYVCTFPIFGLANYLRSFPAIITGNLAGIINLLNVFLYSSFTIAFLCRVKMKSMSSYL